VPAAAIAPVSGWVSSFSVRAERRTRPPQRPGPPVHVVGPVVARPAGPGVARLAASAPGSRPARRWAARRGSRCRSPPASRTTRATRSPARSRKRERTTGAALAVRHLRLARHPDQPEGVRAAPRQEAVALRSTSGAGPRVVEARRPLQLHLHLALVALHQAVDLRLRSRRVGPHDVAAERHEVGQADATALGLEGRLQDAGVVEVPLPARLPSRGRDPEEAAPAAVQDGGEDARAGEVGQAGPVDGAVPPHQRHVCRLPIAP
jgi:hypothetical protein